MSVDTHTGQRYVNDRSKEHKVLLYDIIKAPKGAKVMYLSEKKKDAIINFLKEKLKPEFIYLFGSFAKGEGREDSDIDIAIYLKEDISDYNLFIISNKLAFELKKDVQIVNLRKTDTVFASQIVGTREELYCKNDKQRAIYNMRTFKEYAKLNEERKVIIDAIKKDGKVYA